MLTTVRGGITVRNIYKLYGMKDIEYYILYLHIYRWYGFLMADRVYTMRKSDEECGDGVFGLNTILIFKRMQFSMEKDKRNF